VIIEPTALGGVYEIDLEPHEDVRGSFSRVFCRREFEAAGLVSELAQCSISENRRRGTLRGLHYQIAPSREVKVVRCVRGSIFDVALDLRIGSPTFLEHHRVELSAQNGRALYIPPGCAHGFQTLEDNALVLYFMTDFHRTELGRGVRWNDEAFGISWPIADPVMLDRDRHYPDFQMAGGGL
jgi:dTDP-4-dehydrorhamnose 3,5-epimerase